jgi:hypothetical protein
MKVRLLEKKYRRKVKMNNKEMKNKNIGLITSWAQYPIKALSQAPAT